MKAAFNSLLLILAPAALIVALGSLAFNRGLQPIPAAGYPALPLREHTLTSVSNLDTIAWWSQIETNDLPAYRDRLRAIGCPEPTVQDILIGLIQRRFGTDLDALSTESAPPFWH